NSGVRRGEATRAGDGYCIARREHVSQIAIDRINYLVFGWGVGGGRDPLRRQDRGQLGSCIATLISRASTRGCFHYGNRQQGLNARKIRCDESPGVVCGGFLDGRGGCLIKRFRQCAANPNKDEYANRK